MFKPIIPALSLAVLLGGCTMAPHYERPVSPVAIAYPDSTTTGGAKIAADLGWREFFKDPRLQKLIELSLANNRDLRVATLRVEQARAQYRIQRAALLPTVNANGSGTRAKTPGDLNTSGQPIITDQFSVGLGVTSYELDLFGRVRSLKDRALETYFATDEAARSAHLALVAQVATQYLTLLQFDEQIAIARQTIEVVSASYKLRQRTFEIGTLSELDLRTAEVQVQTARSSIAALSRSRAQAENTLAVLVGQPLPNDLPAAHALGDQGLLADLPAGLPSDLLQRRPDLLAAEHTLKAANANIGAARAAFFPRIALTGSFGTASADLDGLFKSGSEAWSFAPSISVPIFAAGSNRANLDIAKVSKEIEVANYEKAIQTAFREVADALVARDTYRSQLDAQQSLLNAQQRRFELSDMRYQNGVDNYLVVLLAQQDLYTAQQSLVQSRAADLINLVTLYKSLGGGWQETAATPATGQ